MLNSQLNYITADLNFAYLYMTVYKSGPSFNQEKPPQNQDVVQLLRQEAIDLNVLREVEGLALVMLCSCRIVTRKLAAHLLKEVRAIFSIAPGQVSIDHGMTEMRSGGPGAGHVV